MINRHSCQWDPHELSTHTSQSRTSHGSQQTLSEREFYVNKIKKQREKMEKMLVKFEQQKQCMSELQEYIDELEQSSSKQQTRIKALTQELTSLAMERAQSGEAISHAKTVQMMREQLRLHEGEKRRWEKEQELLETQHEDDKELLQEQIEQLKNNIEQRNRQHVRELERKEEERERAVSELENANHRLRAEVEQLRKQIVQQKQLTDIILSRQGQAQVEKAAPSNEQIEAEVLQKQLEKTRQQLKKVKRQNFKLATALESKELEVDTLKRERRRSAQKEYHNETNMVLVNQQSTENKENQSRPQSTKKRTGWEDRTQRKDDTDPRIRVIRQAERQEVDRIASIFAALSCNDQ